MTCDDDADLMLEYLTGALTDPVVLGRLLNQLLKVDAAEAQPTERGVVRPEPDPVEGAKRLSVLLGERYQMRPFVEAFAELTGDAGVRSIAARTGLSRSTVQRLRSGEVEPSVEHMLIIANAYQRDPVWFVEYRTATLTAAVENSLRQNPETSAAMCARRG